MKVNVSCFGTLDIKGLDDDGSVEVEAGATVEQVLNLLPLDHRIRKHLPVMVNGKLEKHSHPLKDGDELVLVIPAPGG